MQTQNLTNGQTAVRVRLPGIHPVKRKLVDGTIRMHYYAWRGGPAIKAHYGTPAFVDEYNRHIAARDGTYRRDSTAYLVETFLKSPEGQRGAEKTVSERQRYAAQIIDRFGGLSLRAYASKKFLTELYEWRDELAHKPRTADERWYQFGRIVKWGVKRGLVASNPLENYEKLYQANRADMVWKQDDFKALIAVSSPQMQWVYKAVIHLGTRAADLRALKWSDIEANQTRFKPSKGSRYKRIAKIPHTPFFRALLAEIPRKSIYVFTNTQGRPWSESALKSADSRARDDCDRKHLHFHDLRGSAATIKAASGYTAVQIAGMFAWSLNEVQTMLDRYVDWNNIDESWDWAVNGV